MTETHLVLVDKIVHDGAGPFLRQICSSLPPLGIGGVEITPAFELPAKCIGIIDICLCSSVDLQN